MPGPVVAADSPEVLARFHAELDLVDVVARQLAGRFGSRARVDDLRSFGREGLLKAARTFDASRGVPFRRWANLRIKGEMIDGIRAWGDLPRHVYRELRATQDADRLLESYDEEDAASPATSPEGADDRLTSYLAGMATAIAVGTMMAAPRDSVDVQGRPVTPEDLLVEAETMDRIKKVVATLPDKERSLVEAHYFRGEDLDDAARAIGLSKSWGSRLHARAIESITRALQRSRDL